MSIHSRRAALAACALALLVPFSAAADYGNAAGYGSDEASVVYEVSHSGYPSGETGPAGEPTNSASSTDYVVIEVEQGVPQDVGGETVIVVQEPDPVAATDAAPPPAPTTVAVAQPAVLCSEGIWVEGHWAYGDGQYVWVDGHCVVERVNYVFVHPRWDYYSNVWWFVPGYYRPCGVWVGYGYYRPRHWFPPYYHPYYRGYRGVPVGRGVPYRGTVARPVGRAPVPSGRVPTLGRQPGYRAVPER